MKYKILTIPYLIEVLDPFEYYFHSNDSELPTLENTKLGDTFWACRVRDPLNDELVVIFNKSSIAFFRSENRERLLKLKTVFSGSTKMSSIKYLENNFKFGDIELKVK